MNEQATFSTPNETSQLVQLLNKFLPYWPLFLLSVSLAIAVAYLKLRAEQPMYVAYGKIYLKDPNKGTDSKVLDAFSLTGEKKVVENEILVLRSANLLQEVVRRLHLNVSVFNEGRVRTEELYGENSPVSFVPTNKDSVSGGGTYYFKVDWAKGEVDINNQKVPFNSVINIGSTDYKVVPNQFYNKTLTGKNYFAIFNSIQAAAGELMGEMSANAMSASSSVIEVRLNTPVPLKGTDILNMVFLVYNEYAILDKNQTAQKTLDFIDSRLAKLEGQLDTASQNVVDLKSQNEIFDLQTQAEQYFKQSAEVDKQRNEVELQLSVLNNVKKYVNSKSGDAAVVPSLGGISDPSLNSLVSKLYEAETDLKKLKAISGEKSNDVVAAEQQVTGLRSDINENINNVEKMLSTTRNSYSRIVNQNNSKLRGTPQQQKEYDIVLRQENIKASIYIYLLTKREETAVNSASTIADLRILETPNAYGPVSPVPKSFYSTAIIIGLLIPTVFVFLREQLNRKVLFRSEIEQKTSVPVVAEIAQVQIKDSPFVIGEGKRSVVAEQFRSFRTNLTFMGLGDKSNTILITSSVSGEGKSFVAINLAVSFSLMGKKVALLEMDLRKPKISKLLGLKNDLGISNYLVNQATLSQIIKPTAIKDLFVLSSGIIPPNPTELIQREQFKTLMADVKANFDYVIIDSAPVVPVTDAYLLRDYADATIFVVRHNKTMKVHLKLIEEIKRNKKFKNLCIVFNGLRRRGFTYGGYGYGSYGAYGGGSGYYVSEEANGSTKGLSTRLKKSLGINS